MGLKMNNKFVYFTLLVTILIFVGSFYNIALPTGQPTIGHSAIQDFDVDFLISMIIYKGGGLYSSFSMVYPPGRYILQAVIFSLFGPSYPLVSVLHIATQFILFPISLFLLSFLLLRYLAATVTKKETSINVIAYVLALAVSTLDVIFIRSAQEVHVVIALFFVALLVPGKISRGRQFLISLLLGLVFLFRIDAGIILVFATGLALLLSGHLKQIKIVHIRMHLIGIFAIWIPLLLLILFKGSLQNFLYDTLYLGLIMQPRVMSLPIPENELRFVFI